MWRQPTATIGYARVFVRSDIEFVRDLPLRRLDILDRRITDLTPVHDFGSSLVELRVDVAPGTHIDLTLLPRLQALACAWDQAKDTIGSTDRLEDPYFSPYREPDLSPVTHLTSLRSLRMKPPLGVRSLDSIETMPWLAQLGIYGAPVEDTTAWLVYPHQCSPGSTLRLAAGSPRWWTSAAWSDHACSMSARAAP